MFHMTRFFKSSTLFIDYYFSVWYLMPNLIYGFDLCFLIEIQYNLLLLFF